MSEETQLDLDWGEDFVEKTQQGEEPSEFTFNGSSEATKESIQGRDGSTPQGFETVEQEVGETDAVPSEEVETPFDPEEAANRLTEKQSGVKRTGVLRETKETILNSEDPITTQDLNKLYEYVEEQEERVHPAENMQFTTDIFGNVVNPREKKESVHQYAVQMQTPNTFDHLRDENGQIDLSIGAQEASDVTPAEKSNDPTSEHFIVCVTRDCPIKENCLRYRLKNKRENKVPFYPEECSRGQGGFIHVNQHPEFTAYDPLDPENLRTMPNI